LNINVGPDEYKKNRRTDAFFCSVVYLISKFEAMIHLGTLTRLTIAIIRFIYSGGHEVIKTTRSVGGRVACVRGHMEFLFSFVVVWGT
jgi:hypothetical protein